LARQSDDLSDQSQIVQVPKCNNLIAMGELQLFTRDVQNRIRLQADQLDQEVAGLASQLSALNEEIALVEKEHAKIEGLSDQGLVEGSRLYTISRHLARTMGQRGEIEAHRARAAAKGSEIQLQIIGIEQTARTEAQRELRSVDATMSELKERYTAAEDRLIRTEIRAPISGIVNELKVHTVGGVVSPAETLVTLVPHTTLI
jgi:multidrug resistance efflux pump